jgi:hypothetical protein
MRRFEKIRIRHSEPVSRRTENLCRCFFWNLQTAAILRSAQDDKDGDFFTPSEAFPSTDGQSRVAGYSDLPI